MENQTWSLVKPPKGRNIIICKWVEYDVNGEVKCFKGRLLAQGFLQCYSVDYEEFFLQLHIYHQSVPY